MALAGRHTRRLRAAAALHAVGALVIVGGALATEASPVAADFAHQSYQLAAPPLGTIEFSVRDAGVFADGGTYGWDAVGCPGPFHGTVTPAEVTVAPGEDATFSYTTTATEGTDSFCLYSMHTVGGAIEVEVASFEVAIVEPNQGPSFATNPSVLTATEDTTRLTVVSAHDPEGDPVTYALGTPPSSGTVTVDAETGTVAYTPLPDQSGPDHFTVVATDDPTVRASSGPAPTAGRDTLVVEVTVAGANDAPVVDDLFVTVVEDGAASAVLRATDADGDALTYALDVLPTSGTATLDADDPSRIHYVPAADSTAGDEFTVVVDDGQGGTATATVQVEVVPVNDAPSTVTGPRVEVTSVEDQITELPASALFADRDDALVLAASEASSQGGSVAIVPGAGGPAVRYEPRPDFTGADEFTVTATDTGGQSVSVTVAMAVQAVDDAPPMLADVRFSSGRATLPATDADGEAIQWSALAPLPAGVSLSGNTVVGRPASPASVVLRGCDPRGRCTDSLVTLPAARTTAASTATAPALTRVPATGGTAATTSEAVVVTPASAAAPLAEAARPAAPEMAAAPASSTRAAETARGGPLRIDPIVDEELEAEPRIPSTVFKGLGAVLVALAVALVYLVRSDRGA